MRILIVLLVVLTASPVWATSMTGFVEGTAANNWQGDYAVQFSDGTATTGTNQMTLLSSFASLSVTTEGCTASPSGGPQSCVSVANLSTGTTFTMPVAVLNLSGTSTLGSLGTVSWGAQPFWLLPGDPAPTAAVLALVSGTLGGDTLDRSTFSFGFNGTLTAAFDSVAGGQALSALRLDFTDGTAPPTLRTLLQGPVFIDNGVPVALGTALATAQAPAPTSVPEPSTWLLLLGGLLALIAGREILQAKT